MDPSKPLNIVRLDGIHTPAPFFSPTFKHTYSSYDYTSSDDTLIISRLLDADVCITTRVPITSATLAACPRLKLIAVLAIGTDMLDLAACKAHNVTVCNVPAASNESVAEQAIALFFALRRNVVRMHGLTSMGSLWGEKMTLKSEFGECPRTCRGEVVGILGGGELGKVTG
jgi:lactate dehydrogenase-like 2-hydroxyacid dehydrogenase